MEQWLNTSNLRRAFEYTRAAGDRFPRILFLCPRQSGKTTTLFEAFLETNNSVFMTTLGSKLAYFRSEASRRNPRGDNLRPMYDILTLSNPNPLRGRLRKISTVFIDDAERYRGDWGEFFQTTYPSVLPSHESNCGVVAAMTPNGRRGESDFEPHFTYIRRPLTEVPEARRSDFNRDYFDEEDFII